MNTGKNGRQYSRHGVGCPSRQAVCVALCVVVRGRRVLVARRRGGHLCGYSEFPGGKIRRGEDAAAAMVREVAEETGVQVRVVGRFVPIRFRYPGRSVVLLPFRAHWLSGTARPYGTAWVRWIPLRALGRQRFPAANRTLLMALARPRTRRPLKSRFRH